MNFSFCQHSLSLWEMHKYFGGLWLTPDEGNAHRADGVAINLSVKIFVEWKTTSAWLCFMKTFHATKECEKRISLKSLKAHTQHNGGLWLMAYSGFYTLYSFPSGLLAKELNRPAYYIYLSY